MQRKRRKRKEMCPSLSLFLDDILMKWYRFLVQQLFSVLIVDFSLSSVLLCLTFSSFIVEVRTSNHSFLHSLHSLSLSKEMWLFCITFPHKTISRLLIYSYFLLSLFLLLFLDFSTARIEWTQNTDLRLSLLIKTQVPRVQLFFLFTLILHFHLVACFPSLVSREREVMKMSYVKDMTWVLLKNTLFSDIMNKNQRMKEWESKPYSAKTWEP